MVKDKGLKLTLGLGSLLLLLILSTVYIANERVPEHEAIAKITHERPRREVQQSTFDDEKPKFSFDDVFNSNFSYKSFSPRWVSGNEYIYSNSSTRDVYVKNVETGSMTTLMDGDFYINNTAFRYDVSPDRQFILLMTNYVKGWRHSYNSSCLVYDVNNAELLQLNTLPDDIQYITWAPQGNALVYVHEFNIFYRSSPTATPVQITNDGRANHIYNGIPDWVYEEEMISSNNVIYFSPDGSRIAFAQFDDSQCDHIGFIRYDGTQYPTLVDVSYPKAGTVQPTNKVFIYDVNSTTRAEVTPTTSVANGDYLFNRVVWYSPTRVAVIWCDRAQTKSSMLMFDENESGNWLRDESMEYEHEVSDGWLYQRRPYWIPVFGDTERKFFTVLPSENQWQQLALVDGESPVFLTQGSFTVTSQSASYPSVYHYDSENDYVYFLATIEGPGKRQVYRQRGEVPEDPHQCVTCEFASNYSGRCDYVQASFSDDGSYVVINCRGEGVPLYALCEVERGTTTALQSILSNCTVEEDNQELTDKVEATSMSMPMHGEFDSTTGYKFHYEMWVPPNFDDALEHPLLIDVYAGPGYQNVDYLWTRSWAPRYVPVNLNAIVVRVDGRGSNFYGDQFMHEVYKGLGQKEIEDQIEAARYFGNLSYVDANNIAIWGWSYGGFATSHAIGSSNGVIKCGLAVAPLTDWRLYDTIYAERYMGLPSENEDAYDKANVMSKAANFSDSKYYLIHGMTDDNVHFQNAANLERALVDAEVSFKTFFYADQDHSINVGGARRHVYKVLTRELCECFGMDLPEDIWPQNR